MSKHTYDFETALKKVRNGPKGRLKRSQTRNARDRAIDFCHLVKKFPRQAAMSNDALDFATHLAQNGDGALALEAIEYLFDSEPKFLTYNRHFGFAIEALIHKGFASKAKEIFKQAVKHFPENMAANASTGAIIDALITNGHQSLAASQFSKLAIKCPEILASNPDTGWIIDHLIAAGKTSEAVNAFITIATHHPISFSMNKTVAKAISAIEDLDTRRIFGEGKSEYIGRLIDNIHKHQLNPIVIQLDK